MTLPPFWTLPPPVDVGLDGPQAANIIVIRTSAPTPTDQRLRFLSILVFTSSGMRSSCAGVEIPSAIPYDSAYPPAGLPTTPTCSVIRHQVCTSHTRARIQRICDCTSRGFARFLRRPPGKQSARGALCMCQHCRIVRSCLRGNSLARGWNPDGSAASLVTLDWHLRLSRLKAGGSDPLPLNCFRPRGSNASQFRAKAPGPSQATRPPSEPVAMVAPLL